MAMNQSPTMGLADDTLATFVDLAISSTTTPTQKLNKTEFLHGWPPQVLGTLPTTGLPSVSYENLVAITEGIFPGLY